MNLTLNLSPLSSMLDRRSRLFRIGTTSETSFFLKFLLPS